MPKVINKIEWQKAIPEAGDLFQYCETLYMLITTHKEFNLLNLESGRIKKLFTKDILDLVGDMSFVAKNAEYRITIETRIRGK